MRQGFHLNPAGGSGAKDTPPNQDRKIAL